MAPASLEEKHHFFLQESLHVFSSTKKMGGQEFCDRYQDQLEAELVELWQSFRKHNEVRETDSQPSGITWHQINFCQ